MMKMMIDDNMWNPASWMDCKIKHHETPHICEHFIFQWVDTLKTDDWWKWPLCFKNWNLMKMLSFTKYDFNTVWLTFVCKTLQKSLCLADYSAYTNVALNQCKQKTLPHKIRTVYDTLIIFYDSDTVCMLFMFHRREKVIQIWSK